MGMVCAWLEFKEIDNVHVADLDVRKFFSQENDRSKRFLRWDVSCRSHYHVRFDTLIIAGPFPYPNSLGAVLDCRIHVHELQVHLLVANDDIYVVFTPQAVIGHREQGINVWR